MPNILTYGAAALVILGLLAATTYTSYHWGYNAARLKQSELTAQALAKSAQHIIDEQAKLNQIEDIINKDTDETVIKSPVLMRTLVRVSTDCSGKTKC